MQNFSAGKAMSEAFEIFKARFMPMAILTVLYYVVIAAVMGTFGLGMMAPLLSSAATGQPADPAAFGAGMFGGIILLYIVIYALNFWQQGAMCRLTSDRHDGSLGDAIGAGLKSILPLFGVAILAFIGIMAFFMVFGMVIGGAAMGAGAASGSGGGAGAIGLILGLVAFVAGVWLAMRCSMILPAIAIEEQRNPLTAIGRSWSMTKGHALKLFALFVVVFAVMGVVAFVALSLTVGVSAAGAGPEAVPGMGAIAGFVVAMIALGLTIGIYLMALVGAIYRQLGGQAVTEVEATFA
jgi:hypothetical protein